MTFHMKGIISVSQKIRNIIKMHASFYVSIPKEWAIQNELDTRSPVTVSVMSDGTLQIKPKIEVNQND